MAFAYHMEALRKQRVIDRQHAALLRIAMKEAERTKLEQEQNEKAKKMTEDQEIEKTYSREQYLKSMATDSKTKQGVGNACYTQMIPEKQKQLSQKDLRHQEKILRDNCLYMGHVNDYFLA